MTTVDYSALDRSEASGRSFYPRRHWTETPEGAVDYGITVDDGIALTCRFFAVGRSNPTVLFFYGNGETVCSYDDIAPHYNEIGANIFLADYRGYGAAGGSPSFSTMLSDAHQVLQWLRGTMRDLQFTGPLYVMGRSMGRHSAIELATQASDQINGVIIESGRPNLGRFADGLEPAVNRSDGSGVSRKGVFHLHPDAGDTRPVGRERTIARRGRYAQQNPDRRKAPGNHSRRRPQRSDVRRVSAVFRRNQELPGSLRRFKRIARLWRTHFVLASAAWQSRLRRNDGSPTCVQPHRDCHVATLLAMTD